jgi:hypothetical protein
MSCVDPVSVCAIIANDGRLRGAGEAVVLHSQVKLIDSMMLTRERGANSTRVRSARLQNQADVPLHRCVLLEKSNDFETFSARVGDQHFPQGTLDLEGNSDGGTSRDAYQLIGSDTISQLIGSDTISPFPRGALKRIILESRTAYLGLQHRGTIDICLCVCRPRTTRVGCSCETGVWRVGGVACARAIRAMAWLHRVVRLQAGSYGGRQRPAATRAVRATRRSRPGIAARRC